VYLLSAADGTVAAQAIALMDALINRQRRKVAQWEDHLDDALRAINWSRNVRFQTEISETATNLREWVKVSATSIAEYCSPRSSMSISVAIARARSAARQCRLAVGDRFLTPA
jgi:hypothetical protein